MTIALYILIAAVCGALNGLREAYHKDNEIFSDAFEASEDGWFGRNSWMLKYADYPWNINEAFPGAKSFMAWVTDYWHFSNAVIISALVFLPLVGEYSLLIAIGIRITYSFVSHIAFTWVVARAEKKYDLPF